MSVYCRPTGAIREELRELEMYIRRLEGELFIINGDFNARSPSWFSDRLDERGEDLEAFAISSGLVCVNQESD